VRPAAALRAAALAAAATACQGGGDAGPKDPGQAVGDAAADTALLREANAAANEVVRNAADCPAARAAIAPAYAKLDDIDPKLRTETGRTSLAAIRKQVDRVAELCPG
jgi:hypothetical protein